MEEYLVKDGKRLRLGYTTGSCAAAAAKAAAWMLLTGRRKESIRLQTPKGIELNLKVLDIQMLADEVRCAIRKDSGDDPDVTRGTLIFAAVRKSATPGVTIDGGEGVGRVTKPGLDQPVGAAAINSVPRKMIEENVREVCMLVGYDGGIDVTISAPEGEALAKKTFNPRLGIEGGISILGTTGIVEPMSEQALTDSIRLELSILQKQGHRCVLITPGNYGKAFLSGETIGGKSDFHALAQMADRAVKCSNFVGDTLDMCVQQGFSHALLVGHIGKFSKLAAGVMNTHSRYADARLEVFTAHAALAGADRLTLQQLMSSVTTDEAIACLDKAGIRQPVLRSILQKIQDHVQARAGETMKTGVILFSNVYGYLGETDGCREILQQVLQEYEQERNDDDGR